MNRKLMAVAVAGALAAPGVAFAQASSVTISGFFKVGWENVNYGNSVSTRLNSSQYRLTDNSSRIIFNTVEDLGNGLAAIGQLDVRFDPSQASTAPTSNPIGSGNSFVGLRSTTWGTLTLGRWDLHYGKGPSEMTRGAGALQASDVSLFDYIGGTPIANATRTQNVVKWDSPNWSGFDGTIAWSANPGGNFEADMSNFTAGIPATTSNRRGDAWNVNPRYSNGPFAIEYSYWRAKTDAPTAATAPGALGTPDQRGDSLTAKYSWGGFKVGLGANRSKLEQSVGVPGVDGGSKLAERTTWSIAGQYAWGPHTVFAHYDEARNIKSDVAGITTDNTGAKMFALAYEYALSKRTSLAATYAQIKNEENINYNLFTSNSLGSADTVTANGEDPRIIQLTILHRF
jgi:predicted porin